MKFNKTLPLDSGGDLATNENKSLYWIDGPPGVEQELRIRLATFRGESPFDPDFGLPVFDIAGAPEPVVEREIRETLLFDDRVASVPSIDIDFDPRGRHAEIDIEVQLVDGEPLELTTRVPYRGAQQ